jgi:hypothetical protein
MVSGSPASSSTKTVNHVIAEILLKAAIEYQQSNQIIYVLCLRVPNVVSVSGLTILDCSFAFLLCLFENI